MMNNKVISNTISTVGFVPKFEFSLGIMRQLSAGDITPRSARLMVSMMFSENNPYLRMTAYSNAFNLRKNLGEIWVKSMLDQQLELEAEPCAHEQLNNLLDILNSMDQNKV